MRKRKKRKRMSPWELPQDPPPDQRHRGNGSSSGFHGILFEMNCFRPIGNPLLQPSAICVFLERLFSILNYFEDHFRGFARF
jgi:hypothetical protein